MAKTSKSSPRRNHSSSGSGGGTSHRQDYEPFLQHQANNDINNDHFYDEDNVEENGDNDQNHYDNDYYNATAITTTEKIIDERRPMIMTDIDLEEQRSTVHTTTSGISNHSTTSNNRKQEQKSRTSRKSSSSPSSRARQLRVQRRHNGNSNRSLNTNDDDNKPNDSSTIGHDKVKKKKKRNNSSNSSSSSSSNWCIQSKETSRFILGQIATNENRKLLIKEIHLHLKTLSKDMRNNELPIEKYIFRKKLTYYPQEEGNDKDDEPHVIVAKRMIYNDNNQSVKIGDYIPYIIVTETNTSSTTIINEEEEEEDINRNTNSSISKRAYHPDEIIQQHNNGNTNLMPDVTWYLENQILPPVIRLCSEVTQTNDGNATTMSKMLSKSAIANKLGLTSSFKNNKNNADGNEHDTASLSDNDDHTTVIDDSTREFKLSTHVRERSSKNNNKVQFQQQERKPSQRRKKRPSITSQVSSQRRLIPQTFWDKHPLLKKYRNTIIKKLKVFWPVKLAQLACVIYIIIVTFATSPIGLVDSSSGDIIDVNSIDNTNNGVINVNGSYRPIVAEGPYQKFCLAMSRMSAFSLYPVLVLVFITKCKAWNSYFSKTPFSLYMFTDHHELHTYAGHYIAFDVWIHTIFHLLRWIDQGNINLLWTTRTGLSGLIVVLATPINTFPMMYLKRSIPYEIRKGLHYLFYVFAVGMCFHTPPSGVPNGGFIAYVLGFCICLYTLDALYVCLFMTEKIETTTFHVLPTGVQMTMAVSERFQRNGGRHGGIVYVCLPWVSRDQWHAFSLFQSPSDPSHRQVFMQKTGDWTNAVHKALQRNTVRPIWVQGPFVSPYSSAESFDNQILVASGIGITPALSIIDAYKDSRRINLIWAVRDPAMLEFFLDNMYLDHNGWNLIFYTGKEALNPIYEELNTNVRVIKGRPDLKVVIPNIIYGIESGIGLPESFIPSEMARVKELLIDRMRELDDIDDGTMTNNDKLKELTNFAKDHGFLFSELMQEEMNDCDKEETSKVSSFKSAPTTDENNTESKSRSSVVMDRMREFGEKQYPSSRQVFPSGDGNRNTLRRSESVNGSLTRLGGKRQSWRVLVSSLNTSNQDNDVEQNRTSSMLTSTFTPWEENDDAKEFINTLDKEFAMSTWGILYCGGGKAVEKTLKKISLEYDVSLNVESFAW